MHTARFIVKVLAVLVGLSGLAWAIIGPGLTIAMVSGYIPRRMDNFTGAQWTGLWIGTAVIIMLGSLLLRQVWIYWRRPDQATARAITIIASFVLGLWSFNLARFLAFVPKPGAWSSSSEVFCGLSIILVCYLFYRLVLRRLAEQAYPDASESSQPGVH